MIKSERLSNLKKGYFILVIVLIMSSLVLSSEIIQTFDISYATDHSKQKLDVFRPADNPNAPLIVLIHGGGWYRGERAWTYQDAIKFAQSGYSVACIGYRLVTDYSNWNTMKSSLMWENMKSDLMHGLEYLKVNSSTLGIDASKAITMGSSAGGHLSLVLKSRAEIWVQEGVVSQAPEIVGVVSHNPATDLQDISNPYLRELEINVPVEDIDPIYMTPSSFEGSIIVHGDSDTTVSITQSMAFIDHLLNEGVDAKLAIIPNADHSFIYEIGLDSLLAPGGEWILPDRTFVVEHGQIGFDASMAYIRQQTGYELPYTPFFAVPQYYYYGDTPPEIPLDTAKPTDPTASWLFDNDTLGQFGGSDGVLDDDSPDDSYADTIKFNYMNNKSIDLDGDSDFVHFGNPDNLQITDQMTVSLWIKRNRDSSVTISQYILSKYDFLDADGGVADNNNRGWMIFESQTPASGIDAEVLGVQISADGTSNNRLLYWNTSDTDVFDNEWHHVAFTFDTGTLKLYIDGTRLTGDDLGTFAQGSVAQIYNSTDVVSLGAVTDVDDLGQLQGDSRYAGGLYDEVAIWDTVLSDSEILWLANNSLKTYDIINGDANTDGLVDTLDFSIVAQNWLNPLSSGGFTIGDFNSDGLVNIEDVFVLAESWLVY